MSRKILHTEKRPSNTVSLGCPKNLVDTEIMLGGLTRAGWEVTGEPAAADLLLVNTCSFIEPACQEAVDTILDLARLKQGRPEVRLVVAGCLVQRYGPELTKDLPEVDLFIGVNDFLALPDLLAPSPGRWRRPSGAWVPALRLCRSRSPPPRYPGPSGLPEDRRRLRPRLHLLSHPPDSGPHAQPPPRHPGAGGRESSRGRGQRTHFGGPGHHRLWPGAGRAPGIAALLRELAAMDGFRWIRLLYGHPARVTPELLATMAASPRILPYLDIPIQHGHDEVLRRMGRGYSRRGILGAVQRIREALPGATLRTTVMTGFPGETEAHSEVLCDLIQEVGFDHLGVFLYSPEAGTKAASFRPQVPRREARRRARRLKAIQAKIVKARLKSLVGTTQEVLVEGVSPESDYLLTGRMTSQAPDIDGQVYITAGTGQVGEIQPVRLTRALPYDLVGEIVETGEKAKGRKGLKV